MKRVILIALISLSLISCGHSAYRNKGPSLEENNAIEPLIQIEGDAYLQGEPGILRGLKVYACDAKLRSEFERVYAEKEPELTEFSAEYGIYHNEYEIMVLALEELAKTECNKLVETDINGHYSILARTGEYFLFAASWSSERDFAPYWLLSVEIKGKDL